MPVDATVFQPAVTPPAAGSPAEPCVLVVFGALGDLMKRLLLPALYNLACDRLLPGRLALLGVGREESDTERFRAKLGAEVRTFSTRATFDEAVWRDFAPRLHFVRGEFDDPGLYRRLADALAGLDAALAAGGNVLFYLATPPSLFGTIAARLDEAGLRRGAGWRRLIVEKPFGHDLPSAAALSRSLLEHWPEEQLYRIDHYLGKETVQNLLAFRFANGAYEPLWNKAHVDHVQISVAETVGVETRGGYYDKAGVLRDMIQNHLFQVLAYVAMEPPSSFRADAVRSEKAKLLESLRVYKQPAEVARNCVRGQYGPGRQGDGTELAGYRQEKDVAPDSRTETFAALRLFIDNWRWEGVPIYLRSGKRLWKRGTEVVVQFKKAPGALFRDSPAAGQLEGNRLIFHIQPDQGIEFRFHAKTPGPALSLQKVNMRFDYKEAFEASRGTGYEVLLYGAMLGDATLFSRTDLVEAAWRVAQPVLDAWAAEPPADFPNYPAGSWGPRAAFELPERDGRRWVEVVNRGVLERVPLFAGSDPVFLHKLAMMLRPAVCAEGDTILRQGDPGGDMYFLCRGTAQAFHGDQPLSALRDGDFFGELSLLRSQPRSATIRAASPCDLFVLEKGDFEKVLREHPAFAERLHENARNRYR